MDALRRQGLKPIKYNLHRRNRKPVSGCINSGEGVTFTFTLQIVMMSLLSSQRRGHELMEDCFYYPSLPFLHFLSSPLFFPLPPLPTPFLPFPSPPVTSRAPLNQLGVSESAVSSHSGVRSGAPTENEFGAL